MHKAGFVNIIGRPNAGKSTLMNAFIGQKLSIITPKAQTTRHRIIGIANGENYQVVFSDTPGIIKPKYKLQEKMMDFVEEAFTDADIMLFIIDITDKSGEIDNNLYSKLNALSIPLIVAINKVDLAEGTNFTFVVDELRQKLPKSEVYLISALHGFNISELFNRILELLPVNPPYYPKEDLSDKNIRFFVAEIIREKIFMNYHKEVPYSVQVEIDSYKEEPKIDKISATIYVERDSQKGIIIGKNGEALKKIGISARKDIESFIGKQVFLELYVKVKKDWRNDDKILKSFGYGV